MDRLFMMMGALLMLLGVGAGAFGAHGLSAYLARYDLAGTFETAVRYHIYHALALFVAAWAGRRFWPAGRAWRWPRGAVRRKGGLNV